MHHQQCTPPLSSYIWLCKVYNLLSQSKIHLTSPSKIDLSTPMQTKIKFLCSKVTPATSTTKPTTPHHQDHTTSSTTPAAPHHQQDLLLAACLLATGSLLASISSLSLFAHRVSSLPRTWIPSLRPKLKTNQCLESVFLRWWSYMLPTSSSSLATSSPGAPCSSLT